MLATSIVSCFAMTPAAAKRLSRSARTSGVHGRLVATATSPDTSARDSRISCSRTFWMIERSITFQKVPGGIPLNLIPGLAIAHEHRHNTGAMRGIRLYIPGRHAALGEHTSNLLALRIVTYPADDNTLADIESRSHLVGM